MYYETMPPGNDISTPQRARPRGPDATSGNAGSPRREARNRLDAFGVSLQGEAQQACERFPDLADDELIRFAVGDLLPNRVAMATIFLTEKLDVGDAEHLDQYLESIEGAVQREVAAADSCDGVANAILSATEDLHTYLLGHELVDRRYSQLQSLRSTFRREQRHATFSSVESWQGAERVSTSSAAPDAHEYALAA